MVSLSYTSPETDLFVAQLDAAVEAHMNWSRRVLRCAVLRTLPGADVLHPMAHVHCRFGDWFAANRAHCNALDAKVAQRIEVEHRSMHDAVRALCACILNGQPGRPLDLDTFEQSQSELLRLLARLKTLILTNATRHDPLTGLPLRYGIEHDFTRYQSETRRSQSLLFIGMIDIDHFKRINDQYGHPEGDAVLRHLAGTLRSSLRSHEPLYRFGGEEFLWLTQCKSAAEAGQSAQRLLNAVRMKSVPIAGGDAVTLTITLGLAQVHDGETLASAIRRSDAALYAGKKAGRDRYIIERP